MVGVRNAGENGNKQMLNIARNIGARGVGAVHRKKEQMRNTVNAWRIFYPVMSLGINLLPFTNPITVNAIIVKVKFPVSPLTPYHLRVSTIKQRFIRVVNIQCQIL
jgi:hypothetical protein